LARSSPGSPPNGRTPTNCPRWSAPAAGST
jgi:hypothetical protein